jgi:hypothetical protein
VQKPKEVRSDSAHEGWSCLPTRDAAKVIGANQKESLCFKRERAINFEAPRLANRCCNRKWSVL